MISLARRSTALSAARSARTKTMPVTDLLPDEPGGYSGYKALFGLKYIAAGTWRRSRITTEVPLTGFNQLNFDPTPAQTLAVVETMLKKGIPRRLRLHRRRPRQSGRPSPQRRTYFRPRRDSLRETTRAITTPLSARSLPTSRPLESMQSNTLFVFTPDEGDHFVGGAPSPANCDGAKIEQDGAVVPDVPCTYGTNGVGELDLNLSGVVARCRRHHALLHPFRRLGHHLRAGPAASRRFLRPAA